jgi:Na+-driven multidrug efflux pump
MNIVLDYVMIARWGLGLRGAALATGISVMIPMMCGVLYFLSGRSVFRFIKFSWDWQDIGQMLFNGSSEMIGQLSVGFTTWVFNRVILLRLALAGSGFSLFTAAFLLNGFNILITAYFTSIGNAVISFFLAFLRGLLLINFFVLVLPLFMGDAGIWASYPLAELATLLFAVALLRKSYNSAIKI